MKKVGKIALASAIALGGVGSTAILSPLGASASESDYADNGILYAENVRAINVVYSSPDENKLRVNMTVTTSDDSDITDFQPRYTIQDANGVIKQEGLLNKHTYSDTSTTYGKGNSVTDIDVSALSAGDYRIKVYQPVTGNELKSIPVNPAFPTMECHFHIKLDRAVNDFITGPLQN